MSWNKSHVGMIHHSDYWGTYALILDVDLKNLIITELDAFGGINRGAAKIRRHGTALDKRDKFYTVAEFAELVKSGKIRV